MPEEKDTTTDDLDAGQNDEDTGAVDDAGTTDQPDEDNDDDGEELSEAAKKRIAKLNAENAKHRTKAREASQGKSAAEKKHDELIQRLGKALGLVDEDKPADPDALMQQLTTKDGELKQKTVQLAVYQIANKPGVGADSESLLDSKAFMASVEKLDHSAETFLADLESVVKDAVKANPKYKTSTAGQAPPQSGGEIPGGPGEQRQKKDEDLSIDELRAARRKARGLES